MVKFWSYQDMLALFSDFKPKFVKNFANIGEQMTQAFKDYDAEVEANTFPAVSIASKTWAKKCSTNCINRFVIRSVLLDSSKF